MNPTPSIVRWGVLSTARIATRVGKAIHQAEGAELAAVASRSLEKAQAWAAEHGAGRSYGSYEALLDDPQIDAVYIPLPPSMHAEWTVKAAQRGKHVLCEKPLAMSAAEAEEMAAACREHNVQLMDGVMWLHHPRAAEMHRFLADGTLGELRRLTSAFTFCWDVPPEADFRLRRDLGGGSLGDLGWYCIGAALWAFGQMPERVFGTARYYGAAADNRDVDMNFSGLMWFGGERMASFDSGFDVSNRRWLEAAGTHGSLVCDDFTRAWNEERPRFWLHGRNGKMAEHVSSPQIQEVCMIEDFGRIVRSGTLDDHWPAIAVETQRLCDALDRSARTGRVVEL